MNELEPERQASLVIGSRQGGGFRVIPICFELPPSSDYASGIGGLAGKFRLLANEKWLVILTTDRVWILSVSEIDEMLAGTNAADVSDSLRGL